MRCYHCRGHHDSEYCPGYYASSMDRRLEEVSESIESISMLNGEALSEVSDRLDSVNEGIEGLQTINRDLVDTVRTEANSLGHTVRTEANSLGRTVKEGFEDMSGSILAAGFMVSLALAGIGAVLHYRQRMDQIRHQEQLEFEEEASDAGRARRELKLASILLFVGDASQAAQHIDRSIQWFPTSAESFRMRSIVESFRNQHEAASLSLKTALKLADSDEFLPHLKNINGTISDSARDSIYVSIVSQLALEMALLGQEQEAVTLLDTKLLDRPDCVDLHYVRLRMLSKTKDWNRRYEDCVRQIVELSPQHFNLLFLDQQLGSRLEPTRAFLNRVRDEAESALKNKSRVLISISKGRADFRLLHLPEPGKGSYVEIRNAARELGKAILSYR